MGLGGFIEAPKSVTYMDGTPIDFEHRGHRILLKNLPQAHPDKTAGVTVIRLEYGEEAPFRFASYYPQHWGGEDFAGENKI